MIEHLVLGCSVSHIGAYLVLTLSETSQKYNLGVLGCTSVFRHSHPGCFFLNLIFPCIGNYKPNDLKFFRRVETTKQLKQNYVINYYPYILSLHYPYMFSDTPIGLFLSFWHVSWAHFLRGSDLWSSQILPQLHRVVADTVAAACPLRTFGAQETW